MGETRSMRMLRHLALWAAIVFCSSLSAAGCLYPVKASSACQQQIDACMKECPPSQVGGPQQPTSTADARSDCERRCHQLCR